MRYVREQWDRVSAWIALGLGGLLLFSGWAGVSDKLYPAQQIPYLLSGGFGGLFLISLGGILWLSADLRDEWRKLDDIDEALRCVEKALRATMPQGGEIAALGQGVPGLDLTLDEPSDIKPEAEPTQCVGIENGPSVGMLAAQRDPGLRP